MPNVLVNSHEVELVYDGYKYSVLASKTGEKSYFLQLNNSGVHVEVHRMADGAILLNWDGASYTTYILDQVSCYQVTVGNRSCIFEKENDPTLLRSPSTGKLLSFTVDDGGHVFAGEVYALMEVMKLVMELRASESGCVHYVKRPGAVLRVGMVLAKLSLDDPSCVRQAQRFQVSFFVCCLTEESIVAIWQRRLLVSI